NASPIGCPPQSCQPCKSAPEPFGSSPKASVRSPVGAELSGDPGIFGFTPRARQDPGRCRHVMQSAGLQKMVGQAGFEPTTPSPPVKCATRLRYCPTARCREPGLSIRFARGTQALKVMHSPLMQDPCAGCGEPAAGRASPGMFASDKSPGETVEQV